MRNSKGTTANPMRLMVNDIKRFNIFEDNLKQAEFYQTLERGTALYGVTRFSDLTGDEFREAFLGLRRDQQYSTTSHSYVKKDSVSIPQDYDWRVYGAVGPVLDQGHCGSCWAFSVIGNIEGQWFRKTGQLVSLSKQRASMSPEPPILSLIVRLLNLNKLNNAYSASRIQQDYVSYMRNSKGTTANPMRLMVNDIKRFNIFEDNLKQAEFYQTLERGTALYGVTRFSDLTGDEFREAFLGLRRDQQYSTTSHSYVKKDSVSIPQDYDWRVYGAVGPVLDQGHCGSCWAFSVIGNIEGQWFRKTGQLVSLSKQNLHLDDKLRFSIFRDNLKRLQHLRKHDQGTAVYGITKFSDLTAEEFRLRYLGARFHLETSRAELYGFDGLGDVPEKFDWRELGAVGPIQDQGERGSCWAFSTIGNIEGQWFKKTGQLLTLSEQQLIDCDSVDDGCGGGYPPDTYGDIVKMGGLELNADYPYTAADGVCKMDRSKFKAYVNKSLVLPTKENQQAVWLAKNGPLSAGINADYLQVVTLFYERFVSDPTTLSKF
ncbi:hypothetical protein T265_12431, partial [Opisthorchis viverrini]